MQDNNQSKLPVVIMAGGLGTRVQAINSSLPKPLLPIGNKPILQWEIECLVNQGYKDIILTVSYKAEQIVDYFGDGNKFGCQITYFNETTPLGNAGALFKIFKDYISDASEDGNGSVDFLLLNADSMFDIDFDRFVSKHIESHAIATLFVHPSNHCQDSGIIVKNSDGWVEQWLAKEDQRPEFYHNCANAGLHVLNTSVLLHAITISGIDVQKIGTTDPATGKTIKVDLDRQILKPLAGKREDGQGLVLAVSSPEYVKDMGTPERFEQVESDLTSGLVHSRNLSVPQKAIFLDRDGTINWYVGFLRDIDEFELLPTVAEAIGLINSRSQFLTLVATNQPVVARGEVTEAQLDLIHAKMETLLGEQGSYIDGTYCCFHHPDRGFPGEIAELKTDCDCRKPKTGMLLKASQDFNIDLTSSWMIGDSLRDIECGRNAKCHTILLTGEGTEYEHNLYTSLSIASTQRDEKKAGMGTEYACNLHHIQNDDEALDKKLENNRRAEELADYTAPDLLAAVKIILAN